MPYASAEVRRERSRLRYKVNREAERARDAARYAVRPVVLRRLARAAMRDALAVVRAIAADVNDVEDPLGPQVVPPGLTACGRCDILTARPDVCGYCAAELFREAAA